MFPRALALFTALTCALSTFSIYAGEMVLLGTHPTSTATPYPGIHVMQAFDGRIYMGSGDWNSHPATSIASYDPARGTIQVEHAACSDAIGTLRVIGGELYAPSTDPVHFQDFKDFAVRSGGRWRQYAPAGFLHVFDVTTRTGSDLWFVGSKYPSETVTPAAAVWRSDDAGKTWSDVTLTNSRSVYVYCFALGGRVFVYDTVYDGATAKRITPVLPQQFYKPLTLAAGGAELAVGLSSLDPAPAQGYARRRVSFVTFDGTNAVTRKTGVLDLTSVGTKVYTLDFNSFSGSNEIQVAQFTGAPALAWSVLPISNVPTNATSIEVLGNSICVGDTAGQIWVGKLDGSAVTNAAATTNFTELPDGFGRTIVVDDTTLAIGAPDSSAAAIMGGQVTVWTRSGPGQPWSSPQVLSAPQPSFSGWFGKDIAVQSTLLAVLEAGVDPSGNSRGSAARVHLYERSAVVWELRQTITNAFAQAVALKSNMLWVGASTSLHRYAISAGANGSTASFVETIASGAAAALYEPAAAVSADGNRIAFANTGDFSRAGGPGLVNIYEFDGATWRKVAGLQQTNAPLPASLAYQPDAFGFAVAFDGDWLAVGAPRDDTSALQAGAVLLYQRVQVGTNIAYIERQKILGPLQQDASFGASLAFRNGYLAAGAPGWSAPANRREGRVFVYRIEGTNVLPASDIGAPPNSHGEFGAAVAIDGDTIVVGSRAAETNAQALARVLFQPIAQLRAPADLALTGNVSPQQAAGGTAVEFALNVTNRGPSNANDVVVTFTKPTNATLLGFSSSAGVWSNGAETLTCSFAQLANGAAASMQITLTPQSATSCEVVRLLATAAAREFDGDPRNDSVAFAINDFPPSVEWNSPPSGTVVRFGSTVPLAATAAATNGIAQVMFFTNGALLASVSAPPFSFAWAGVPPGTYALDARVLDQCGILRTSAPVTLVAFSNSAPTVAIASPLARTRFASTNYIPVQITAADGDGSIALVNIYAGTNLLRSMSFPPFAFTWTNAPVGSSVLRATVTDNDGATNASAPVFIYAGTEPTVPSWVAYNDHSGGPGTHSNATQWNIRGDSPGSNGPLKNILTGASLPVSVTISRSNIANVATVAAAPNPGTPAAQVFGGYIDFTNGSFANVPVSVNQSVTYLFSGLTPSKAYTLKMTAMRGNTNFLNRWIQLTLAGAESFRAAHTSGTLTQGTGGLAANQVAINTGYNLSGDLADWEEVVPGPSGTLSVVCTQYAGPIPTGGSGVSGALAPTMLRLETASLSIPLVTASPESFTVSPGATAVFTVEAIGSGAMSYQWFQDGSAMDVTNGATLALSHVQPTDAGRYTARVASENGLAMSSPAVLTVFGITRDRRLEISGPVGLKYRVDTRADFSIDGWATFTNFVLLTSPTTFGFETNSMQRFFRALPLP